MKTEFTSFAKDNIATAAVLAATFIAVIGSIADSSDAFAEPTAANLPVQRMETITVTASHEDVTKLETILVTATRDAKFVVTPN